MESRAAVTALGRARMTFEANRWAIPERRRAVARTRGSGRRLTPHAGAFRHTEMRSASARAHTA
jgi:hypothetical protein